MSRNADAVLVYLRAEAADWAREPVTGIIETIRALGAEVLPTNGGLTIRGEEKLPDALLRAVRRRSREIGEFLAAREDGQPKEHGSSALDALLARLDAAGIVLFLKDGRPHFRTRCGPLSPDLRRALREHRNELIAFLQRAEAMTELRTLAESIGTRVTAQDDVPDREWPAFKRQLFADEKRLGVQEQRLGLSLADLGWQLTWSCKWERCERATVLPAPEPVPPVDLQSGTIGVCGEENVFR